MSKRKHEESPVHGSSCDVLFQDGATCTVELRAPSDTIRALKRRIAVATGRVISELFDGGGSEELLDDERTVADCDLQRSSVLIGECDFTYSTLLINL
jgi:hypothetical protein